MGDAADWSREDALRAAAELGRQNRWEETEKLLRRTVEADPENLDLHVILAYALIQRGQLEQACEIYAHVLARRPDYYQIHSNLAFVREQQGRFEDALRAARQAIQLRPDYPEVFNNLGMIFRSMHRLDDACRAFTTAVELRSDFALAEFNLGTTHLLAGNYAAGWRGYRHAARIGGRTTHAPHVPDWDGRPAPGRRLLIEADQGFGDTIQFVRFLSRVKRESAARIVFCCQPPLVGLLEGIAGADEIIGKGDALPPCDAKATLAGLPELLGVTLETCAADRPYLRAPAEPPPKVAERLCRPDAAALRVGLVWQGNPQQTRDGVRSCPLENLLPLLDCEGAAFFSLQTGDTGRRQAERFYREGRLIDIGSSLSDFRDTAVVLAQLDLVITVDTATAHLAGALGHPVWTLLCHTPDWRWHLGRPDSPWYPTMRLFRQPRWGDWDAVVAEVRESLVSRIRAGT